MNDLDQIFRPGLLAYQKGSTTPKLHAQCQAWAGVPEQKSEVVWRGRGGSTVTQYPSGAAMAQAIERSAAGVAARLDAINQALDARPAQPVQQASYAQPESYDSFLMRSAIGQPGVPQTIPLPQTGAQPGTQVRYTAINHAPTTAAGMAANAVAQIQRGPNPTRFGVSVQSTPGALGPREATRRSMGMYY